MLFETCSITASYISSGMLASYTLSKS